MSLSRNSEGGIGEAAFLAAASFDAAKLEGRREKAGQGGGTKRGGGDVYNVS